MRKDEIFEILLEWNFWKTEPKVGIRRNEYLQKARSFLKTNMILTITGARRAGKSFIVRQIAKGLIEEGTSPKDVLIINFEDRRFKEHSIKLLDDIFDTYVETMNPGEVPYVFVDEVHMADKWERWARTLNELQKAKITVSGSTSRLISEELGTVLTGRHLDIEVFPLSFKEFLSFRNIELKDILDIIAKKIEIQRLLREYIQYGGFPEVVLADEGKREILASYFDDILTKDIVKRHKIRKIGKIEAAAKFYLTNVSKSTTFRSVGASFRMSTTTAEKYSRYLEEAFLVIFVKRFSFSIKEQENSPRKVYSIDTGLSSAMGFRFSEDSGRIMENIVAVELQRRIAQNPLIEVYYWKDVSGKEADFVVKNGMDIESAIQVTDASMREEIEEREVSGLISAMEGLKLKEGLVITAGFEGEEAAGKRRILFKPLWKWLLGM